MLRSAYLSLVLTVLVSAPLLAQRESEDEDKTSQSTEAPAPVAFATTDIGDLWRWVRHRNVAQAEQALGRRFVVLAPTIGAKPTTGMTLGFSSNVAFFAGDEVSTHLSTLSGSFRVSQKHQELTNVRYSVFTADDRWFLQGDNRLWWTSQDTYGLGIDAATTSAENVKYNFFRVAETSFRRVRRGLFVGGGLIVNVHDNVRPGAGAQASWDQSAYVTYSEAHGLPTDGQTSSGASYSVIYDTRDNAINAQRGSYANAAVRTYFNGFLGGDSTWQQLFLDARTYRKLSSSGRQRLAFWGMSDLVLNGSAPYFDLPSIGSESRSARGYAEGRYRGERLAYGEVEYRGALTSSGLFGAVVFANATTIGSAESGTRLFRSWAPAGGVGLRVLLNKHSRTNLTTDYGWGKNGSNGFYLGIQEAF
jgi:outer membrane protein assembly factor BamA